MCSVSYLCRFLPYCLQLVSYPYFITDCLSSVSLSFFFFLFFFCIQLNLISLYCWDFFQKIFASNRVYCLTLIHINTHYTIQYIYTHTHTHKGMFVHRFFVLYCIFLYCIIFLLVWYWHWWQGLWKFYGMKDHNKKKLKKKNNYTVIYIVIVI